MNIKSDFSEDSRVYVYHDVCYCTATVHLASCGHCDHGRGCHGSPDNTKNGYWNMYPLAHTASTVFSTIDRYFSPKYCGKCLKGHGTENGAE